MKPDERQVAPTLAGIRRDHVARYEFAAARIARGSRIIDFACGIGYGTKLLCEAGHQAFGFDVDAEALDYARQHYDAGNPWRCMDGAAPGELGRHDAAVCFETIEHIEDPRPLLRALREAAPLLIASVPNEAVMPWQIAPNMVTAYHFRHYTQAQFEALLNECGWVVQGWYGQPGPESEVGPSPNHCRTIIAVCVRAEGGGLNELADRAVSVIRTPASVISEVGVGNLGQTAHFTPKPNVNAEPDPAVTAVPGHVAIVGLGPSAAQYLRFTQGLGGRHRYADETWTINALGDVFGCDRIFHMDDVRIQQIRADAAPESNIAAMLAWMKTHPGPIMTSRPHPDYPGLVEFPLEAMVNECPNGYFNSTAAYAVAYAIFLGVKKISLFGCDFTYPDAHDAEKGRACVEFWLGVASERGIKVAVPKTTSLLDALHSQDERFYGFSDTRTLAFKREQVDGAERIVVHFAEREQLPTADEIEARYDHGVHPNPLVTS
jgi:SAM-dependent methyltransferase